MPFEPQRSNMNFGDIVGQSALTTNLQRQIRSGQIVHAYLFAGEEGMGKRTLADICARALVCEGENKPCDECGPCQRALTCNHPDIKIVTPGSLKATRLTATQSEKPDGKKDKAPRTISVDDVRALCEFLARRPYEAKSNIAIIPHAQIMTPQAQNALLKTLETPPGQSVIIMTCDNVRAMLPTIISRCRVINFQPLPADVVGKYLLDKGIAPERAHLLSALSGGSIGRALNMNENEDYWRVRTLALDALGALKGTADIATATAQIRDVRDHTEWTAWILDTFEIYARDLMLTGQTQALNIDRLDQISAQASCLNGLNMLTGVIRARERLKSNVGWQSVLDMICFDALEG